MKAVLQCNTGARVQQYLHHLMKKDKCLVEISVGMCTAMKNGMIASQPSEQDINNYTLFCLPQQDEEGTVTAAKMNKLEEQAKNGKISDEDMDLMTNQKVKFAKTHSELKHYITNFNSLT